MYKKQVELIKPIIYPEGIEDFSCGIDNRLYRSLHNLFENFWVYYRKELYLVGGCVRDLLLGKTPKDYDLCTNATPELVKEICEALHLKTFDSGIKHGTITIIDEFYHQQYEITTYRIDGKYSDGRHPDEVIFTPSLEEDLKRRDFTINSFAYNLLDNTISMLDKSFLDDLTLGIIRTVGDPCERFEEDALRMLRAIRFAAQLGFTIDKSTLDAISMDAPLIKNISKERIRDELTKILLSDNPNLLELVCLTKLEKYLFKYEPEIDYGWTPIQTMLDCTQRNKWHYTDVFHHTMDVVKAVPKEFNLRWAALFHDIGKPATKIIDEVDGSEHNPGHPLYSSEIALELMSILKFSNEQKEVISKFVKWYDYPLNVVGPKKFKNMIVEIGEENFLSFLKLIEADGLAHVLKNSKNFALDGISEVKDRYIRYINNKEPLRIRDLAINGDDLIELGLTGKQIGDTLNKLLDKVLECPEYNNKEKLLEEVEKWKKSNLQEV